MKIARLLRRMDVILSSVSSRRRGKLLIGPKQVDHHLFPPIPTHTHTRTPRHRQTGGAGKSVGVCACVCVWDGAHPSVYNIIISLSLSYTSKLRPCTHKPEGCRHSTTHTHAQELEKEKRRAELNWESHLRVNQKLFNALILDQNAEPMRIGRISGHRRRHMKKKERNKVSNITTPHRPQVNVRPTGGLSIHQSFPPHTHTKEEFVLHLFFPSSGVAAMSQYLLTLPNRMGHLKNKTKQGDATTTTTTTKSLSLSFQSNT